MREPCELIRDLMPLCHDNVASAESRAAVEAHVRECEDCRRTWERLCGGDYVERYLFDARMSQRAAQSYGKAKKKTHRWIVIALVVGIFGILFGTVMVVAGILMLWNADGKLQIHDDVTEYTLYRSGAQADEQFQNKWGMDESIFPEAITPEMDVQDYKMVYYNPWDAQYLGYLVVQYDADSYKAECDRLNAYASTDYIGYYGVTGETQYDLLAVNADPYYGFVYALTDGEGTIIYAEQIFCNYFLDLDYRDYIPEEYLLDGFDATSGNAYREKMMGNEE